MLIDQLSKQEQARVGRAVDRLRLSSTLDDLPAQQIRQLAGGASGQRTFSYRVGDSLRIIFTVTGKIIDVVDVVRPEQILNLRADKQASG
jgi:hypothetical protein